MFESDLTFEHELILEIGIVIAGQKYSCIVPKYMIIIDSLSSRRKAICFVCLN